MRIRPSVIALFTTAALIQPVAAEGYDTPLSSYDEGLFTPLEDLGALSSSQFTTLRHPAMPYHSIRIKESRFCDTGVKTYTGYIDIGLRHMFFYFFESRHDPDNDPLLFWTNGGPGGSGAMSLFTAIGPCLVTNKNTTVHNPNAWNNQANTVYFEQPVGVGFSYADTGDVVGSTMDAGDDIVAFLGIFFQHFIKFRGRPVHMAGESYGGKYIPVFASKIYDQNTKLVEAGLTPVNLTSVVIANGCTNVEHWTTSTYDVLCQDPDFPQLASIEACVRLKQMVQRCKKSYQKSCVDTLDLIDCSHTAIDLCWKLKVSNYDRTRPCSDGGNIDLCYPRLLNIDGLLSQDEVQIALGADPRFRGAYSYKSNAVGEAFGSSFDIISFRAEDYLAALLERGIPVLLLVGDTDLMCNRIGIERTTMELEWSRSGEFRPLPLRTWTANGHVAGETRSGGGLTYATLHGAGHIAPGDKPVEALTLINRWLSGKAP
ncbi:serine carboxypeptidase [Epithele typhae]|uniref:serine carboxypeptidase n=1 Tax=Epithele typhae TaxID=378194 RepID=UPI00200895C3|nr:serine carboxypeptidase [Epithele typhae]KAH9915468.1 serine carboxypeptidase [Epithele typhae]